MSNLAKQFKFAITDNTTYDGKDAVDFFSTALLAGPSKDTFRVIPGVKSKIKLPKYDIGNLVKDSGCSWSPSGEGTLDQKAFEVCDKEFQLELCVTTFEANCLGEFLRPGSNTGEVSPEIFTNYMLGEVRKKISADLEVAVWQGSGTSVTYPQNICDGLFMKLLADADVIDVTATAATSANIIASINAVYNAIPQTVINDPELVIYVPTQIYKLYQQAIANASSEITFLSLFSSLAFSDSKQYF